VDVRVIAATNRKLEEAIQDGSLRQDLFYRLNVVRVQMPPLRERKEDIPALVAHFLRQYNQRFGREVTGIDPAALAALMAYNFSGNVRELQNLIERAYALGARDDLTLADLPSLAVASKEPEPSSRPLPTLAEVEKDLIFRALEVYKQDKERAAKALGLSRRTIYRRLKEYGLL
jgi:two-component system response regulator HydG/two-component system response regulator AtoC